MLKAKADDKTIRRTLIDFSQGRITRQRAMYLLDVDYSELWDMMAAYNLPLPELGDEEAIAEGRKMSAFLSARDA